MKNIICLLAAAALFVGCASRNTETNQGSSDTSVGTTDSGTRSSSGSFTNSTSGTSTNGTNQTQTPSQTPTQTPRGN